MFVPSAQTQAEVGDAKSISQTTNGFGFLIRIYRLAAQIHLFWYEENPCQVVQTKQHPPGDGCCAIYFVLRFSRKGTLFLILAITAWYNSCSC